MAGRWDEDSRLPCRCSSSVAAVAAAALLLTAGSGGEVLKKGRGKSTRDTQRCLIARRQSSGITLSDWFCLRGFFPCRQAGLRTWIKGEAPSAR